MCTKQSDQFVTRRFYGKDAIKRKYLLCLVHALTSFGGLHPHIEEDFKSSARALRVDCRFEHLRDSVRCTVRNHKTGQVDSSDVQGCGKLHLEKLDEVCGIRELVLDYKMTPRNALSQLEHLMSSECSGASPSGVPIAVRFFLPVVLCAMCFNGSCLDVLVTGLFDITVHVSRNLLSQKDTMQDRICRFLVLATASFVVCVVSGNIINFSAVSHAIILTKMPLYPFQQACFRIISIRGSSAGASHLVMALASALLLGVAIFVGSGLCCYIQPPAFGAGSVWNHEGPCVVPRPAGEGGLEWAHLVTQHLNTRLNCSMQSFERRESGPWFLRALPAIWHHLVIPVFALLLSKSQHQNTFSLRSTITTALTCVACLLHNAIQHGVFRPDETPVAVKSFLVAIVFGMLCTITINWTKRRGANYTIAIPGITTLIMLGVAESGEMFRGFGFGLVSNLLLVGFCVTLGLVLGESAVWPSEDEEFLADVVADADLQGKAVPSESSEKEAFFDMVMKGDIVHRRGG